MKKQMKYRLAALAALIMTLPISVRANNISDSTIGAGIKLMLQDATSYLIVLCPIIGGLAAGYFAIRRSMADEQDGKMWAHRIKNAILCGVGGGLVSGVIALISSYF